MKIKNKLIILFLFILFFILFDTSSFAFEIDDTNVWNCIQEALDYGNSCYDLNYSLTDFQDIFVVGNEEGGLFYTFYFLLPNYELSYFFTGNSQCEVFLKNYLSVGYNRDNSVFLEPSTYGEYTAYKPCYYSDANFTGYFPNSSVDKNWKNICSPQIDCEYANTKRPYGHVLYSTVSLWYAGECGIENPNLDFTSIPKPSIPTEDLFKVHLKDLNCEVWRNFTIQYPSFSGEKYLLYLDTFRRDYSNCTNEVEAVFKLIVFSDGALAIPEDLHSFNSIFSQYSVPQKYMLAFTKNENGYCFLYNKDSEKIYVPFNAYSYNIFESKLSFPSTSSKYEISQFEYVSNVPQNYLGDSGNYKDIYGDFVCDKDMFVGSNCNIISFVDNEEEDILSRFVSTQILDRLHRNTSYGNTYKYCYAYDYNDIYYRNSSCYGSNEVFNNEFWADYRDLHKHIVETKEDGSVVVIPETNYVDSGFVVSGSEVYDKNENVSSVVDVDSSLIVFFPVLQTPTNTDSFLFEDTDTGEKKENTGSISNIDKDVLSKDNVIDGEDTSSWGILDFLKGLFKGLSNIFSFLKNALFSIIEGIFNIGEKILSLFIPDSDFWSSFSSDMNSYLNEHLGLVFQPFEILGGVLNRYNNIEFIEPKLVIPEIKVPLTEYILLESREVNFSQVLEIEIIGYLHNIYLCCIDVYLLFLVLNRIRKIEEEVFNK